MRCLGQLGQPVLDKGQLPARQRPQQQRRRQRPAPVQPRDKGRHVRRGGRLVDQIQRRPLARMGRQTDRRLGRDGMATDQMLAHRFRHMGDQPLGNVRRQHLTIGQGGQHFGGIGKPVDDHIHRVFGQIGIVIGGQGSHRLAAARLGQHLTDVARHPGPGGDRHLPRRRARLDDLDQVLVGKGGRKADDRQGHAVHIGRQPPGHIARDQIRGLERHRHRPPHQLGRIMGQHAQDLLGRLPVLRSQLDPLHVPAKLVSRGRAFVLVGRLDQSADVELGKAGAIGRHVGLSWAIRTGVLRFPIRSMRATGLMHSLPTVLDQASAVPTKARINPALPSSPS